MHFTALPSCVKVACQTTYQEEDIIDVKLILMIFVHAVFLIIIFVMISYHPHEVLMSNYKNSGLTQLNTLPTIFLLGSWSLDNSSEIHLHCII